MPKIDLDIVKRVLEQNNTDIQKLNAIIDDLKLQIQIEEEERANRPPPVKKQFVVLLADADGALAEKDITGWILQIPEDDSPAVTSERIIRATYNYNATPKGRRLPVKTIGEAKSYAEYLGVAVGARGRHDGGHRRGQHRERQPR